MKGIDVSSFNGNIDWTKVKQSGVEFAILKVIRKDLNPDVKFEQNYQGISQNGIPLLGVYNYSYADSVSKAQSDAQKVVSILNVRKTKVWLDVEDNIQKNLGHTLIDIVKAYSDVIVSSGNDFGVYTGLSFYNDFFKPYEPEFDYDFWIARYPSKNGMSITDVADVNMKPTVKNLSGWQYSSTGSISGISGNTDLSEFYVETQKETAATHIQLNYHVGQGYCLNNDMKVRNDRCLTAPVVDTLKRGTWVNCTGSYPGKDNSSYIWIFIGRSIVKGVMTNQFVCADDGKKCYAQETQV